MASSPSKFDLYWLILVLELTVQHDLDVPERLRNKRLDAIVLIDNEAQRGELTRP